MLDACLHREDLPEVVTMIGAILDEVTMKGLKTWETQRHDGMVGRVVSEVVPMIGVTLAQQHEGTVDTFSRQAD